MPIQIYKKDILDFLRDNPGEWSCAQITKHILQKRNLKGSVAYYLSGSVSSKLALMVKQGTLEYAATTTPRGGHLYKLK